MTTITDWQLDRDGAGAYERYLVPVVFSPWAADLVGAVDLPRGSRVLDVACGTGIVARHAARHVGSTGEVRGVDVNPAMLAVAREQADARSVAFTQAPAEDLPFPSGSFDAVLCQQGLQFLTDRRRAVAEIARVTRPDGAVAVSTCRSLPHQPGYAVLVDVLARHIGAAAAAVISSPYGLGELVELRRLLEDGGLSEVRVRIAVWPARFTDALGLLRAETLSSPLGPIVDDLDVDVRDDLVAELGERLRPHTDDDGVIFPFETLIATARR